MIDRADPDSHELILWSRSAAPFALLAASGFVCYKALQSSIQQRRAGLRIPDPGGESRMTSRRAAMGILAIGLSALAWPAGSALALDYPTRPVRFCSSETSRTREPAMQPHQIISRQDGWPRAKPSLGRRRNSPARAIA
jgi:hypothetical protein